MPNLFIPGVYLNFIKTADKMSFLHQKEIDFKKQSIPFDIDFIDISIYTIP